MAVLKHLAIKKRDYGDIQRYLIFKCEEGTHKPIRDKMGRMVHRDFYIQDGLNCDPFTFDAECAELNARFGKNQRKGEITAHHYIISFDPRDVKDHGLTPQKAHQLAKEFADYFFDGHQALIVTHEDGNNGSGNVHSHIVINSLRKENVLWKPYMENGRDALAGYKHHLTDKLLHRMHERLYEICERENLYTVDINHPTDKKITNREYHAQRRGQQEKDCINARIRADGYEPIHPNFETDKQQIRDAIDNAAAEARDEAEFMAILATKYKIGTRVKRGRYSFAYPKREKITTSRSLGNAHERKAILERIAANVSLHLVQHPEFAGLPRIFLIPSDLRLVVDLQACVKAQQSRAYARKVELTNLQRMAKTVAWIQENGMGTLDKLEFVKQDTEHRHRQLTSQLNQTESQLRRINRELRHVGRYHSNKKVYVRYQQAEDKQRFRAEYRSAIEAYEESAKELAIFFRDGNYPSLKELHEAKAGLVERRDALKAELKSLTADKRNMEIVWKNVQAILGTRDRTTSEVSQEQEQRTRRHRSEPSL